MEMASSTADTAQIVPDEEKQDSNMGLISKIVVIGAVAANVMALAALIVGLVGVANSGGANQFYIGATENGIPDSDRVWMLHIGHYLGNKQYLDEESGIVKGYDVDVVNAVCQLANKNCRLVWDIYERCWDSKAGHRPRGGEGLMGGWYDACIGWVHTRDRARTYLFSTPIAPDSKVYFWVKTGRALDYGDFTGLKVGFLDGWSSDEHCLARYSDLQGFDESDPDQTVHYANEELLAGALQNGQIDVAFSSIDPETAGYTGVSLGYTLKTNECTFGGVGIMMPKDQVDLSSWFNAGFENLKAISRYQDICDDIETEHGGWSKETRTTKDDMEEAGGEGDAGGWIEERGCYKSSEMA